MAKVIEPFPNSLNLDIDIWCEDFKSSLQMIDETIRLRGLSFHSKEDMLMHPQARIVPAHAGSNYVNYSPSANEPYFSLLQNVDDEFSAKTRHSRFAELIDLEARLEARNPLQHRSSFGNALSAVPNASTGGPPGIRPHDRISPPATMPSVQRAPTMPGQRPPMQRRMPSNSNPASQSALYNKRAAKPIAGNLFTPKRPTVPHRQNSLIHGNNLPRGLQREKRVQMIDFDDATAMQQNAADALRKAKEDEKMEKLAKRQAALERKRQRDEEEKRAMDEAKEKKAAAKKKAKTTASKRKQSVTEIKTDTTTRSPTASAPASPQTPTSPSPKTPKLQKF
ncbi:hypothetical protein BDF20DRAFT_100756 [Mycotypha africana]|uniref:uncharacterized protein n=1 Tax=Mycotypha africana TaxID=64632 RepID=UPI0023000EE7|nr:uncharacterized protein BDF20DRAFT_100756 [Mycotypha africana]KAI8970048.1 hypothetical protein BDF20DRAFT_100756 [Mycotypha africana]